MENKDAQRLTAAWARSITARTWPWPVPDSGRAIDNAREAMYLQLLEYVPDEVDAAAAVWQADQPRVVVVVNDSVLIAGVELEAVDTQSYPVARGVMRAVPLDPQTATLTVTSTYRTGLARAARTSRWQFSLGGEGEPLELTAELADEGEITADERLARVIAARLGWSVPEGRRLAPAA